MGGRSSRDKGAVGEREVARLLAEYGFTAHRTPLSGGMQWKGDVQHDIPSLHIEVKRCERISMPAWTKQAEDDCPDGQVPAVIYRSSRQPWRIVLPLDHYMELQKEARDRREADQG